MLLDGSGRYHEPSRNSSFETGIHPVDSDVSLSDTSFDSGDEAVTHTEQWRNYVTKTGILSNRLYLP